MMKLWFASCAGLVVLVSTTSAEDAGFYVYSNELDRGYNRWLYRKQLDSDIAWASGTRVQQRDVLPADARSSSGGVWVTKTPGGDIERRYQEFWRVLQKTCNQPIEDRGAVFPVAEGKWFQGVVCRTRQTVKDEFGEYTSADMYVVMDHSVRKVRFIVMYPYEFHAAEKTDRYIAEVGGKLLSHLTGINNGRWRNAKAKLPVLRTIGEVPDPGVNWSDDASRRLVIFAECDMPRKEPDKDGGDPSEKAEAFKGWICELRTLERTYRNSRELAGRFSVMTTHITRDGLGAEAAVKGFIARHNKRLEDAK